MWKISTIKLLYKKGIRTDKANYRPISITPCLARLFERMILLRFNKFLDDNDLIIVEQSGFRSKRQTKDNLVTLTQKAKESNERGWKTITVFFDLASAFDKVWHDGLIYKLNELGVPLYLLNILISFLKDRFFEIKIGSFTSARFKATRGCPQGACVSPSMYMAYSNDTPLSNTKNVSYALLFADDLVHFRLFKKA